MSSTRYASEDSLPSQEAYASSGAHEAGLLGNLVARRCKVAMLPEHRRLCYFVQQLSHREGGLKRVVAEILKAFPERFRSNRMKELGITMGRSLTEAQREALKQDHSNRSRRKRIYRDWMDGSDGSDDPPVDDDFSIEADELFAECRAQAEKTMEAALRALCLDPEADMMALPFSYHLPGRRDSVHREVWWIDDFVGTLEMFRQRQIDAAREAIAETEITRLVHEAIDMATFAKGLAVVEGDQRTGKSTAAKNYCALHPGECVFIDLEPGGDDTTFFRSLARSIGTNCASNAKAIEMRGSIEAMLQGGHLTVVFDESHYLIPISARPKCAPKRLEWVRRCLVDKGVAVVLVSTPQFDRQCTHYEKHLSWNAKQLKGRIIWQNLLPATLPEEEITAVARKIAPQALDSSIKRMVAYAVDAPEYLFGIDRVMKIASCFAQRDKRATPTRDDIKHALDQIAPQKACKAAALPVQTPGKRISEAPLLTTARQPSLDLSASEEAEFEAGERLQFTGAAALD